MGEKIVIIGAVAAGPKSACRVKRLMPDAEVLIVDQDNLISYGGCGIPYYVSGDVSDEDELRKTSFHMTRDESFFLLRAFDGESSMLITSEACWM